MGLFLFSDALVLTRRMVHHTPFALAHRSTHTFQASVALASLAVREITHSRCEFLLVANSKYRISPDCQKPDRKFLLCRREPRLRPAGAASFLGLCHRKRGGEGALPVHAALSHNVCSARRPVTSPQRYDGRTRRGQDTTRYKTRCKHTAQLLTLKCFRLFIHRTHILLGSFQAHSQT